jgi:3',5'-cyclic AMP phosphodiesterase CpdA
VVREHGFRANQRFEPLPPPTGPFPYRLELQTILGPDAVTAIQQAGQLVWHMVGDTGGVKSPQPQQIVADTMGRDFTAAPADRPALLYLLGDVVYYNGERDQYYPQFYEPYAAYPAPITAIPGNHDGDPIRGGEPSLAAFVGNFCSATPHRAPEAQETHRDTMIQPNVYWTLRAPFVTIVGLYSNVPEGGRLDDQQISWLHAELAAAPRDRFLLVTVHHPPYSADAHHGGSAHLGGVLDSAFLAADRVPHAVLTGHVHNYQRFTRPVAGRDVPYLVAGAGGHWHLHPMAHNSDGTPLTTPWTVPDSDVTLEHYVDDRHGYLRLTATAAELRGEYVTVPRPQESWTNGPVTVADTFTIPL